MGKEENGGRSPKDGNLRSNVGVVIRSIPDAVAAGYPDGRGILTGLSTDVGDRASAIRCR
tara:strand:+ start:296567 stop:296746 length:180 start_codon:yes stop_codon:yes gene_type:complete